METQTWFEEYRERFKLITRYAVTYQNPGRYRGFFGDVTKTYLSAESAQADCNALIEKGDAKARGFHNLEVRPVLCWPNSHQPFHLYFD